MHLETRPAHDERATKEKALNSIVSARPTTTTTSPTRPQNATTPPTPGLRLRDYRDTVIARVLRAFATSTKKDEVNISFSLKRVRVAAIGKRFVEKRPFEPLRYVAEIWVKVGGVDVRDPIRIRLPDPVATPTESPTPAPDTTSAPEQAVVATTDTAVATTVEVTPASEKLRAGPRARTPKLIPPDELARIEARKVRIARERAERKLKRAKPVATPADNKKKGKGDNNKKGGKSKR